MKKCKPITYEIVRILDFGLFIDLKPQQRWDYIFINGVYEVSRDNVTLRLSEGEFNEHFVKID